eukprot:936703-Rhodomonas_salina.2
MMQEEEEEEEDARGKRNDDDARGKRVRIRMPEERLFPRCGGAGGPIFDADDDGVGVGLHGLQALLEVFEAREDNGLPTHVHQPRRVAAVAPTRRRTKCQ